MSSGLFMVVNRVPVQCQDSHTASSAVSPSRSQYSCRLTFSNSSSCSVVRPNESVMSDQYLMPFSLHRLYSLSSSRPEPTGASR
jgi:hypothetical protein